LVSELLEQAVRAARDAGTIILSYYRENLAIETKGDGSPLTLADQQSHHTILKSLESSEITIVSEEGDDLQQEASRYWLVDPLDGTKDFLAGNDEFTVNIALIIDRSPVLGVVYAPALDELYVGGRGLGAWKEKGGTRSCCVEVEKSALCRMAVSRFHDHPDLELFTANNQIKKRVEVGSALKYGQLASASVDVYPRLVGSSEWDTAAGQAVVEAAGGLVLNWHDGKPLRYGKQRRRNPRLLSLRAPYQYSEFKLMQYKTELL
jgi:3'(2'), 5'-bisphosphate nucleotidase